MDHFWFRQRKRLLRYMVKKYGYEKSIILDAGTGTGIDLELFDNAVGMDIDMYGLALNSSEKNMLNADAAEMPFRDSSIECIIAMDLLCNENVSVEKALSEFHRVLKKGGIAVLNLPAMKQFYSFHDIAVGNARRFNRPDLKRLSGFRMFSCREAVYWNALLMPAALLQRFMLSLFSSNDASDVDKSDVVQNVLFDLVMRLEFMPASMGILPFGMSIMAVLKK